MGEVAKRPVIMTVESVRAILAGRKTQTRRIVTTRDPVSFIGPKGNEDDPSDWGYFFDGPDHNGYMVLGRGHADRHNHGRVSIPCPYGDVGDRMWVKERWQAWRQTSIEYDEWEIERDLSARPHIEYKATSDSAGPWRTPLFMPRWASRLTLEVTDVRVQRLQQINEEDARSEGVKFGEMQDMMINGEPGRAVIFAARDAYAYAWNAINGKRTTWASNPWVWAITFTRVP